MASYQNKINLIHIKDTIAFGKHSVNYLLNLLLYSKIELDFALDEFFILMNLYHTELTVVNTSISFSLIQLNIIHKLVKPFTIFIKTNIFVLFLGEKDTTEYDNSRYHALPNIMPLTTYISIQKFNDNYNYLTHTHNMHTCLCHHTYIHTRTHTTHTAYI